MRVKALPESKAFYMALEVGDEGLHGVPLRVSAEMRGGWK